MGDQYVNIEYVEKLEAENQKLREALDIVRDSALKFIGLCPKHEAEAKESSASEFIAKDEYTCLWCVKAENQELREAAAWVIREGAKLHRHPGMEAEYGLNDDNPEIGKHNIIDRTVYYGLRSAIAALKKQEGALDKPVEKQGKTPMTFGGTGLCEIHGVAGCKAPGCAIDYPHLRTEKQGKQGEEG